MILPHLTFQAGVRYDHYESFGGTTNPRLALIYDPWRIPPSSSSMAQPSGSPSFNERFFGIGFKTNPGLQPETIATYELILWSNTLVLTYAGQLRPSIMTSRTSFHSGQTLLTI